MVIVSGSRIWLALAVLFLVGFQNEAPAQPTTPGPIVEVVIENLKDPAGLAIQPETGLVFIAESGGGQVLRLDADQITPVITGFATEPMGRDSSIQQGPRSIVFLDRQTLLVGEGGKLAGDDGLSVFNLSNSPTLNSSDTQASLKLAAKDGLPGEGDFASLVVSGEVIFLAGSGDESKGWIARAENTNRAPTNLRRFISTRDANLVGAPTALAISPEGFLVVGLSGSYGSEADAQLVFFDESGVFKAKFQTGLHDINGIAYSPKSARLFALDFAWDDPTRGGLFELVAGEEENVCVARKVMTLERPVGMVFAASGELYVTVLGLPNPESKSPQGKLLKLTGLDQ